jgi:hypothetical protein
MSLLIFCTFPSWRRLEIAFLLLSLQESFGSGNTLPITVLSNSICVRHPSMAGRRAFLVSSLREPVSIAVLVCSRVLSSTGNSTLTYWNVFGTSLAVDWKSLRRSRTVEPKSTSWTMLANHGERFCHQAPVPLSQQLVISAGGLLM